MATDIVNLGLRQIYIKLLIDGIASRAFSAMTMDTPARLSASNREKIIESSRRLYAAPAEEVEKRIADWHQPMMTEEPPIPRRPRYQPEPARRPNENDRIMPRQPGVSFAEAFKQGAVDFRGRKIEERKSVGERSLTDNSGHDNKGKHQLPRLNSQNLDFGSINLNKQYYVMMGITSDVNRLGWAAGAAALAVAGVFIAPIAGGVFVIGFGAAAVSGGLGAGGGTFVAIAVKGLSGTDYISPTIVEVNSQEFRALGCKSITTLA